MPENLANKHYGSKATYVLKRDKKLRIINVNSLRNKLVKTNKVKTTNSEKSIYFFNLSTLMK